MTLKKQKPENNSTIFSVFTKQDKYTTGVSALFEDTVSCTSLNILWNSKYLCFIAERYFDYAVLKCVHPHIHKATILCIVLGGLP